MLPSALALVSLIASDAAFAPAVPPCASGTVRAVDVLGPGPSESEVPLNTSIWVRLRGVDPQLVTVSVRDGVTDELVPSHVEALYDKVNFTSFDVVREHGLQVVIERELEPEHGYFVDWEEPADRGGHRFTTGRERDDTPPDAPNVAQVDASGSNAQCAATFALTITHDGDQNLLYAAVVQGDDAAIGRGSPVELLVGQPDVTQLGRLVAFDLAGNRSSSGSDFEGTTWSAPVDPCSQGLCGGPDAQNDGVFSCASTSTPSGGVVGPFVVGVMLAVRRRRRRAHD